MKVEGLMRKLYSHLQVSFEADGGEKKAAMNTNSAAKNTSHSTMDDSYYAGEGKN